MNYVIFNGKKYSIKKRILNLSQLKIKKIKNIENLNIQKDLIYLDLSGNEIKEIQGLNSLKNLKFLDLSGNEIKEIQGLENLTNLKLLNLSFNYISEIKGLNELKELVVLDLTQNHIESLKGLESLKKLRNLWFDGNCISKIEGINDLENLIQIDFTGNYIEKIENLNNLKNLRYLSFSVNSIEIIEGLDGLKSLKYLNFDENEIRKIENLENLKNLRYLNLSSNNINRIEDLSNLKKLESLYLDFNPILRIEGLEELDNLDELEIGPSRFEGYDELWYNIFSHPKQIVEYCRRKIRGEPELIEFYDVNKPYDVNIELFEEKVLNLETDDFLNIGTHKENKTYIWIQNRVFLEDNPSIKYLNHQKENLNDIIIHIIQLHSLKGIEFSSYNKIEYFEYFIKHFWDEGEFYKNSILKYNKFSSRCSNKIKELLDISVSNNPRKPHIIIFPENSIPYEILNYLIDFSQKYRIIIIGGLEHKEIKSNKNYVNKAFIIDNGIIGYQVKQTPVRIYDRIKKKYIQENIVCKKIPNIRVFETSVGNVALLICRDFLRLNEIISSWARRYFVDFIIIPSLTTKVLPFHSKLLNILNYTDNKNLKIIFANVGEYGGSEFFSVNRYIKIEENFKRNLRDNVGETIVIRTHRLLKQVEETFLNNVKSRMKIPRVSGTLILLNKYGDTIYVGKTKNLRRRVKELNRKKNFTSIKIVRES